MTASRRVAERVAEIQDLAKARFMLVSVDDRGLQPGCNTGLTKRSASGSRRSNAGMRRSRKSKSAAFETTAYFTTS